LRELKLYFLKGDTQFFYMNTTVINNIDILIEASVVEGQLKSGVSPKLVAARSSLGMRGVAILTPKNEPRKKAKSPAWTEEENKFLEAYLGVLTEKEIADALGRSELAVRLRWKRDLRLTALSKRSGTITAEQIANGLGVDSTEQKYIRLSRINNYLSLRDQKHS
jgi:DNA-binding NarL/FixJ family response regulator